MQYRHCTIITWQQLLTRIEEDIMESKKFPYEDPTVEVIKFTAEDIITTSNGREPAELEEIED